MTGFYGKRSVTTPSIGGYGDNSLDEIVATAHNAQMAVIEHGEFELTNREDAETSLGTNCLRLDERKTQS